MPSNAHSLEYKIIRPNVKVLGESFAEWTEDWWVWALQAPFEQNPILDPTGEFAGVNNDGPVHFVAGNFGGETERTFEVSEGEPLLVPMLNTFATAFDTDEQPQRLVNKSLADWKRSVVDVFAEIDGVAVDNPESYFVRTDFFSLGTAQPGSLLDAIDGDPPPDEDYFPTKAAGYWLMIEGLDPGEHTLHFGGTTSDGFSVDVTADILIV